MVGGAVGRVPTSAAAAPPPAALPAAPLPASVAKHHVHKQSHVDGDGDEEAGAAVNNGGAGQASPLRLRFAVKRRVPSECETVSWQDQLAGFLGLPLQDVVRVREEAAADAAADASVVGDGGGVRGGSSGAAHDAAAGAGGAQRAGGGAALGGGSGREPSSAGAGEQSPLPGHGGAAASAAPPIVVVDEDGSPQRADAAERPTGDGSGRPHKKARSLMARSESARQVSFDDPVESDGGSADRGAAALSPQHTAPSHAPTPASNPRVTQVFASSGKKRRAFSYEVWCEPCRDGSGPVSL
jgi:hypothetical protein